LLVDDTTTNKILQIGDRDSVKIWLNVWRRFGWFLLGWK